jgi:tRNA-2-methylthio-N6-dimethylallyladenosine synthase
VKTFFIHTFGCQMNEYDSERLTQALTDAGWSRAAEADSADLLLANTCTVRQLAEDKAFSLLGRWRRLKSRRPEVIIGMVGCLAQQWADAAFKREPGIDLVVGPRALTRVPELAEAVRRQEHASAYDPADYGNGVGSAAAPGAVSASVAVMEGCEQFCSYCVVPYARGRETSRPASSILAEVHTRVAAGAREILLLGQNVNRYGLDQPGAPDFAGLLSQVAALPGLRRLRFMTGHPKDFSPRLIAALADLAPVCEALHLPLQSGSDRILHAMNRGYTARQALDLIARLRAAVPGLALSTDLIVGFPGEGEEDLRATLDVFAAGGFEQAYCFKYSARRGTPAADLPGQVPQPVKEERLQLLLEAVKGQALEAFAARVGEVEQVLVEHADPGAPALVRGRSRANRRVTFPGGADLLGQEVPVRVTAAHAWSLLGERAEA